MELKFSTGRNYALKRDTVDSLSKFREMFFDSSENVIYLDGNSLGKLPLKSRDKIVGVVENQWGSRLIRSWNEEWLEVPIRTAAKLAEIIGAKPEEVLVCDSTSINLYKLVLAALKLNEDRRLIVSDIFNFPSDIYIINGVIELLNNGHQLRLINSGNGITPDLDSLGDYLTEDLSLITLSHVVFKSAYKYDMETITARAHNCGANILWDLSHSAGAVPLELNKWDVDFAIGCTYKYLNGGPGSPAFLYVREDLISKVQSYIHGWFGANEPFRFSLDYEPSYTINKFAVGTPPILSISPIESALDVTLDAGLENLDKKRIELSEYLIFLYDHHLAELGFELYSPRDYNQRGSHVSLRHSEAYRICQALIKSNNIPLNVIPDFRAPDIIRFGIAPLYNSFEDIYLTSEIVKQIINSKEYQNFSPELDSVT